MIEETGQTADWVGRARGLAVVIGACCLLVGLVVLVVGWWLGVAQIAAVVPGEVSMKANTAFGIALAGAGVAAAAARWPRWIGGATGALLVAVGLATVVEYAVGSTWHGLDELLASDPGAVATAEPGRMAINTATNFVFIGVALVLLSTRRLPSLRQLLGAVVAAIAFVVVLGYVMSDLTLTGLGVTASTNTALHTAVCVLALGVAVVAADIEVGWAELVGSSMAGGRLMRTFVPIFVATTLVAAVLVRLLLENDVLRPHAAQLVLVAISAAALVALWVAARRLDGIDTVQLRARQELEASVGELAASENRFRLLAENSTDVVWERDAGGVLVWVSPAVEQVLGWTPGELIGTFQREIVYPADVDAAQSRLAELLSGTPVASFELRILTAGGGHRWMSLLTRPIMDAGGCVTGTVAGLRDVHVQVLARQELADSERRYKMLAENATDVVWQLNRDRVVSWVSSSVQHVLGWTPEWLVGRSVRTIVHPDDATATDKWHEELFAGQTVGELESRRLTAVGNWRWMSLQARPITDAEGAVTSAVIGLRDIHEQVIARQGLAASERQYRLLAENAADVVVLISPTWELTWVSPATQQILGYNPADLVGTNTASLIHTEDLPVLAAWQAAPVGTAAEQYELRVRDAAGEYRWMSGASREAFDDDGNSVGRVSTLRDIDDQHVARQELADSERRYKILAENATDVVWQLDTDGVLVWVARSVEANMGWDREHLLGMNVRDLIHPADRDATTQWEARLFAGATVPDLKSRRLAADGSYRWMSLYGRLVPTVDGSNDGLIVGMRDIDDEVRARAALAHAIEHDPLTGLATMSVAVARIDRLLPEIARGRPGRAMGVLCVGVDSLQSVNEALTHAAGDRVVLEIAARIATVEHNPDLLARGSGGEILVLLPDLVSGADAGVFAERVRLAVKGTVTIGASNFEPTVSIGIATGGRDAHGDELVRDAALAMHQVKDNGRDRWEFCQAQLAQEAQQRLEIEEGVRDGLRQGQFVPWFQPIVNLSDGLVVGYEALVRWVHPDGRVVPPDDFLPVAERTTLIADLDLAVLKQSVEILARLPAPKHIAANLSATTLASPDHVERAIEIISQCGIDAARLHLEFTETALLDITDRVLDVMREAAEYGVRWYVDDFGTGYSSISHLRDLPIAGFKLDLSYSAGIAAGDSTSEHLALGLAGLAAGLGLDTVAEGVETPEVAAILAAQGWKHAQGWLYGRPAPLEMPPLPTPREHHVASLRRIRP